MSLHNRLLSFLPDKMYIRLQYFKHTHRMLNLKKPIRYNEKLQWIKLYDHNPFYTTLVDKYLVKSYVAKTIGERYVVPLIGVWDTPDQIDYDSLPNRFVLKTNHDSKGVVICKDKSNLNIEKTNLFLKERLKRSGYSYGREWPYKNIERKIIAEQYLEDEHGKLPDYKVVCFNGIPKLIQLHRGRFTSEYTHDIYNTEWIHQPFNQAGLHGASELMPRPVFLEEMLQKSAILAQGIPQVRVDWFFANDQLYFGEMTFFDASGYDEFVPDEMNEIIGSWISLP